MSELNGTGVEYPTIELGGKTYTVKFTGAAMRKMEKAGLQFRPSVVEQADGNKGVSIGFSNLVDVLMTCIPFQGTVDELADLAWPKVKRDEIATALMQGWGNLWQSSGQLKLQETAAKTPEPQQPAIQ
jgi:hypothetical protein